jgi:hypothetical protein
MAKKVLKTEGWVISTKGHADTGADIFLEAAKKLKFSRASKKTIEWLIRNHMLQANFWEMKPVKQLKLAAHPAFGLLLEHWHADHYGTKRKEDFDEHTKKFIKSVKAGKQITQKLKRSRSLIKKLASGDLIMKYSKLEPGKELGQKIQDIKAQIILGKIKNGEDLKNYLTSMQ